jgi:hypothetical protein
MSYLSKIGLYSEETYHGFCAVITINTIQNYNDVVECAETQFPNISRLTVRRMFSRAIREQVLLRDEIGPGYHPNPVGESYWTPILV